MHKVVRIGTVPVNDAAAPVHVFCRIVISADKGSGHKQRLSITGVVGPLTNGNCAGAAGQINDSLREYLAKSEINFAPGWSAGLLETFLDIWGDWHLNDMRAYDVEMRAAGWHKQALTPMRGYAFKLDGPTLAQQHLLTRAAEASLSATGAATLDPSEQAIYNLPYSYTAWVREGEPAPQPREHYERDKPVGGTTLGWLSPEQHPEGLLGRRLRSDGPAFGSAWFHHPLPDSVVAFLAALPLTDRTAAWV